MAEYHHASSTTSLLGIEGYVVEGVRGEQVREMGCPRCSCCRLYRHGKAGGWSVLPGWSRGRCIYLLMSGQRWQEPLLNHFDSGTTHGLIDGCYTKIENLS